MWRRRAAKRLSKPFCEATSTKIWKVLQALKEQDDLLSQIIDDMRIQRGRTGGFDESRFRERVEMIGPEISLDSLRQSITAACLDAIGEGWFERYGQLLAYRQKYGNRDMPARWPENQKLATWVVNQRVLQKDGVLEEEKIALLDRIGFKWSPHASKWRTIISLFWITEIVLEIASSL